MRLAKIKVIIILRICFKKAVHVQGNFPFCYDQSIKTSKIKTLTAREINFFVFSGTALLKSMVPVRVPLLKIWEYVSPDISPF